MMKANVSQYLRDAAERAPRSEALLEERAGSRSSVTWAEVDERADAVASALSARGLVAGQRVAMVMSNRIDLAVAYFGILRGGMVAVPVNPRSTTREIGRMLADSAARVVLADEIGVDRVREAVTAGAPGRGRQDDTAGVPGHGRQDDTAGVPGRGRQDDTAGVPGRGRQDVILVVDGAEPRDGEVAFGDFLAAASGSRPVAPADPEALAVLLYTSGTSGKPRGVMLSHRALVANIEQVAALETPAMTSDDTTLVLLPLFHIYGLNCVLGQAVRQGARCVFVDGFDPDALLALIADVGVTNVPIAPPVIAAWAGRPGAREALAGVQRIMSGASALDTELAEEFETSTGQVVEQGYGLTESSPVITATLGSPRDGSRPKPGSVGHPLPGIELRVVDASGRDASAGDPAEVWVKGDNLFSGYWPDGADGPRADGWYPTGDIGFLDADGDLTLVDRLRELVIVSGFNVYPFEVEEVIAEVPGVAQVAVVGLPDEETGESVLAIVVPQDGADADALPAAVREHCEAKLARFKLPARIEVADGLPYSATGKVAKGRLRALARSRLLGLDT